MLNRENVAKRIAYLRKKHALSQAALAEALAVSTQAVSKWECAQSLPDVELLLEMARLFGVSVDSILDDAEDVPLPRADLPPGLGETQRRVLRAASRFFGAQELALLAAQTGGEQLEVRIKIGSEEAARTADELPDGALAGLSAAIADALEPALSRFDKGLRLLAPRMTCPKCGARVSMKIAGEKAFLACESGHQYELIDGVPDFDTREIPGEYWSVFFKNYEKYCEMKRRVSGVFRGMDFETLIWGEIERRRPKMILDIASGAGDCVGFYARHISWPCVVVLADISCRILKYDRMWLREHLHNPNVRFAHVACDCAKLPFADETFDCVTSLAGFESMQNKCMDGLREARRALKEGGSCLYTALKVMGDKNTAKWMKLIEEMDDPDVRGLDYLTREDWLRRANEAGFTRTETTHMTDELEAPAMGGFPYTDSVMQWTARDFCVSEK